MWYNGGPLAGELARISDRVHICKIFVQSSSPSYRPLFSRKLALSSNFIFKPPLTHISNFIWHIAHSNFLQLTKFQLLIANLLRYRSGPVHCTTTRGKTIRNQIIRAEAQLIRSGLRFKDSFLVLFPLDFYNKICYYIKKRYKNTSVLA